MGIFFNEIDEASERQKLMVDVGDRFPRCLGVAMTVDGKEWRLEDCSARNVSRLPETSMPRQFGAVIQPLRAERSNPLGSLNHYPPSSRA